MTDGSQQFLHELAKEIGEHPEKEMILQEYEVHIMDLMVEEEIPSDQLYTEIINRLGSPEELATVWKQETSITPKKTQWLFVFLNVALFIGGGLLTFGYNYFEWKWMDILWQGLTNISLVIICIYILFWGLLGYEIGKEFGYGGRKLLIKTFLISVLPNLVLMYLIVFKQIPREWFGPLLNAPFIVTCIILTAVLYPVSWLGYRWGRKRSI
ncbi:HAAS signaling domain-containing protein [Ornithinibacillus halophilus]|uniref:Uncharacterized protein n=1 Tax=Ornithinibacillus halophilus TaxID=930117 RepID=A0A1M5DVL8_9BACI|nr:hypothetical protein [Ornithinibacillus halophilus]SHF70904.1 hypothetical protein SAMN05216225_100319 [Ornithinibacillus halophilus]